MEEDNDEKPQEPQTDWKAYARKWEERAKANAEKAKELDALSETHAKTVAELEAQKARAAEAEAEIKRRDGLAVRAKQVKEAAEKYGIPSKVLEGYAGEDVEAYAESIKPYFPDKAKPVITSDGMHAQGVKPEAMAELAKNLFNQK